ncbi:hypothetical protein D2A34_05930 [Clostridium chromiireducens]|uniref:Uncharacterized protein n=1 Tax=Clostridium chromiireducens TaxID=225345 RepID=A0A399INY3_9CLOT|nr:hypothetical protein [Clostridium chromiireducens]RII34753.1 hypothetical protein D2A34_05930 [Clostridium chromiireducens]
MRRKIRRVIMFVILITLTLTNIAYAQPTTRQNSPYGPKVEDLKGKENIIQNLEQIKKIRSNLTIINISGNSSDEQLKNTDKDLENFIQQLNIVRRNLENHKNTYKDSFPDIFFSEQISFVADSYIISIRLQQNLIRAFESNNAEAKKLFYSNYLIPVYYYLTLGDQMVAYIDTYFVLS